MKMKLILAVAALCAAIPGQAAIVADSLPYTGTPAWTDITFSGTSMTTDGTKSVLTTAEGVGVWFGWGTSYGDQPAWTPGAPGNGNYLALTASFSSVAADWSAYFYDGTHLAWFQFNPTDCENYCYDDPNKVGVNIYFGGPGTPNTLVTEFIALDTTDAHLFEFLLRDGTVSYRIDGVAYSGAAFASAAGPVLVIGDGSGGTQTGVGSMTIHGVSLDNAPEERILLTTAVPEPSSWAMMIAGCGLAGAFLRRRRADRPGATRVRG